MTMPEQKPGRSKQDYATPVEFIAAVKHRLSIKRFAHDFAADSSNHKARTWFSVAHDGLSDRWNWYDWIGPSEWGWLNPPFDDIDPWARRCCDLGDWGHIALLVPAGVGSNWFRDYVDRHALVLLLNGRLCFIDDWEHTIDPASLKPGKGPARFYTQAPLYPKDCILCLFGPDIVPGYEVWNWRKQIPTDGTNAIGSSGKRKRRRCAATTI